MHHGPPPPTVCLQTLPGFGPPRLGQAGGRRRSRGVQGHLCGWLAGEPPAGLCSVGGWNPSAHAGRPPRLLSLSPLRFCLRPIWNRLFIGCNVGTQMHPRGGAGPAPRPPFPLGVRVSTGHLAPWWAPRAAAEVVCTRQSLSSRRGCCWSRHPCSRAFVPPQRLYNRISKFP